MDLLNNRYKIILPVKDDQENNTFLVIDNFSDPAKKLLRIIKPEIYPKNVIEYFRKDFITLSTLKHPNITAAYNFSILNAINSQIINTRQFFYTYEYFKGKNIYDASSNMNQESVMNLIIQLLHALKYLHRRGFLYRNIDARNISVIRQNGIDTVKLNNIIVPEHIEKILFKELKSRSQFRAPEVLKDDNYTMQSDLYSLGVLLFYIITRENPGKGNFAELVQNYKNKKLIYDGPFIEKNFLVFMDIIAKLTEVNTADRYNDIVEVTKDINTGMNKNYSCFTSEYLGKLIKKTVLIGREDSLKKLYFWKDNAFGIKDKTRLVLIDGELGVGKSRLLKEFIFNMETDGVRTFTVNSIKNQTSIYGTIGQLLRQLIPFASTETITKYGPEIKKIIPEEKKLGNFKPSQALTGEREKRRLKFCAANFIIDTIQDRSTILSIDNAQWADTFTLELVDFLIEYSSKIPLMIIMACRTEECRKRSSIKCYLDKWSTEKSIDNITLKPFAFQETGEFIKNLLGIWYIPRFFTTRLLNETQGYPLFVKDILSYLVAEKKLSINENGYWRADRDKENENPYTRMYLPANINEAVLKQIDTLAPDSKRILEIISVFYSPVPLNTIKEVSAINNEELTRIVDHLVSIQLLESKVDDWGYLYDFHLTAVKNQIYDKIEPQKRKEMHKICASVLERLEETEDRVNNDELIYQYCEACESEKALKYIIKSAELMMSLSMNDQALNYLEKALFIAKEISFDGSTSKILYMTGELYYNKGENSKAIECLNQSLCIASSLGDTNLMLECYIILGFVYNRINEQDKAIEVYRKAEDISKKIGNTRKLLDVYDYLSRTIGVLKNDYVKGLEIVNNALEQYGFSDNYSQLGALYNEKGLLLQSLYKADEALVCLEESIKFYEMAGNSFDITKPENNIGVLYFNIIQDYKKALYYFEKCLETELKRGRTDRLALQYHNLSSAFVMMNDYTRALDYLFKEDEIVHEIGAETSYLSLFNSYLCIFLMIGEYGKALEYLEKSKSILEKNSDRSRIVPDFYPSTVQFYYEMGLFEDAILYATKGIDECYEAYEDTNLKCQAYIVLARYHLTGKTDFNEFEKILNLYRKTHFVISGRTVLHNFAEVYLSVGRKEQALKLIKESMELVKLGDSRRLRCAIFYLEGLYYGRIKGLKKLEEAELLCKVDEDKPILWKIYRSMGDTYLDMDDKPNAIIYYLKSMDILYRLYCNIPAGYRISFLRSHGRYISKEKLLSIKRSMINEFLQDVVDKLSISSEYDKYFLDTFFEEMGFDKLPINWTGVTHRANSKYHVSHEIIKDLLGKLSSDLDCNLEIIMEAMCNITLAENCFIQNTDSSEKKIYGYSKNISNYFEHQYIAEHTEGKAGGILCVETFENRYASETIIMPEGIRALMCMPITGKSYSKRNTDLKHISIKGYVYLDTSSIQNNFNNESFEYCKTLSNLISLSMDNDNLKTASLRDKLTGVYTRKFFESSVDEQLKRVESEKSTFSIIMIDIDLFKNFNDRYGHQKGDEVLHIVGEKLLINTRSEDICCRYGGEEFVIILPDTGIHEAEGIAESLRKAVEETRFMELNDKLTISLGISNSPKHGKIKDELIRKADHALYRSKELGRNHWCTWNSSIRQNAIKTDMLSGIITGNFMQDQRNMLALLEVMDIANKAVLFDDKMYRVLGRIMEAVDSEQAVLLVYLEGNRKNKKIYARRRLVDGWQEDVTYNTRIVKKAASGSSGLFLIDWDGVDDEETLSGSPLWNSVMAVPVIDGERLKGVLYLTSPVSSREYGSNDLNFANIFSRIISIMLG